MTDDQLQMMLDTKVQIGRYHRNAKVGYAKIIVPNGDIDQVLKLDLSVSGNKLRVEKWRSFKAPSHRTNRQFLDAQARPNGRRLYSQVASNTAEARMKSMETAIYDVKQLLKRLSKPRQ